MEDKIWDTITDKAKTKFDFDAFSKDFSEIDENIADNILFKLIVGFASGETKDIIAIKLHNDMLMTGFIWDRKEIDEFLSDKADILKLEIYVTQLAGDMLKAGNKPITVLQSVNQLLN